MSLRNRLARSVSPSRLTSCRQGVEGEEARTKVAFITRTSFGALFVCACVLSCWPRVLASFVTAPTYPLGRHSRSMTVADFNGDGIPDLAVVDNLSGTVSVLLGKGDGTFGAAQSFAAGSSPIAVAAGDFNGDGILDVAVANEVQSGTVSILLGKGDGSFQAGQEYTAGSYPSSVAVGDFNGDGILDVAVANEVQSGTVSILLGNSDGSFQAPLSNAVGTDPVSVSVADFNGDGKLDLVVANYLSRTVSILLGKGDGSFQAAQEYTAGSYPSSVAVADFNGDGIPDVAVANRGYFFNNLESADGSLSILLGNGDGTFQAAQNHAAGSNPSSVAVADFNGDGIPDLAVAGGEGVSLLLGNGDGTFRAGRIYAAASNPVAVAVADFNHDGVPDLAVSDAGFALVYQGVVSILLGKGDGTFPDAQGFAAGPFPSAVAVADFNGDGILDLAVANNFYPNSIVSILLGKGDGTFGAAQNYAAGPTASFVAVADFNGDGHLDLLVLNPSESGDDTGTVSILLGNGDGTFQAAQRYAVGGNATGGNPTTLAIADFNGDGILDVAVPNHAYGPSTVSILLGNGDGSFGAATHFSAGLGVRSLAAADINGDGKMDLVATNFDFWIDARLDRYGINESDVRIYLGHGDGTFQEGRIYGAGEGGPDFLVIQDINGDGIPDLIVADDGHSPEGTTYVSVLLGNGDGTFQPAKSYNVGSVPSSLIVVDFSGDGVPDIAVATAVGVSVLLGKGDGTFQTAQWYPAGGTPSFVAAGDFNGDGYADLAVANNLLSGTVTVLLNAADWGL